MNIAGNLDRPTVVAGITLAVLLLPVLYLFTHLWMLRAEYAREIDAIQPRAARLLGITESRAALESAHANAVSLLRDLAYPAGNSGAATAAAMQQNLREVMASAGLTISGSKILPVNKTGEFDRIGLEINAEGNIESLDTALAALEAERPLVFIEFLRVRPEDTRRRRGAGDQAGGNGGVDPRQLNLAFRIFSLRLTD